VDSQNTSEQVSPVKLAEIGKMMHVTFPDGTKVLGLLEEPGGIDRAIHLKVEFAAKDLEEFVKKSPFVDSKFSTTGRLVTDLKEVSWWRPESVKAFRSAQVRLPEAKILNILIDLDRSDKVTVFLMWFST